MCSSELWNIGHGYLLYVWFVQSHTKVPLATQYQEDEDTDVEHPHQRWERQMGGVGREDGLSTHITLPVDH